MFALADVPVIVTAGALGGVLYQKAISGSIGDPGVYAGSGVGGKPGLRPRGALGGLYRLDELLEQEPDDGRVWMSWGLAILVLAVILFLFKSGAEASRGSVVCLFVLGGAGLVPSRRLAKRCLRSALVAGAIRGRRAIVIGTGSEMAQLPRQDLHGQVRPGRSRARRVAAQ